MSLSVIIPSKTESNLWACIQAIRAAGETCRIIAVDDGIDFNDWECRGLVNDDLQRLGVEVVDGAKPFNFSRNVNLGILWTGEDDCLLLNDDAMLQTPLGFTKMNEAILARPHLGIVSAACTGIGNLNQNFDPRTPGGAVREEPRVLAFVCVLLPRRTIDAVGLLDPRFTSYGWEDTDYSRRVREAGLKLGIFDGCRVDHESLPSTFGERRADLEPGRRLYVEKWGDDQ